jgi:hypothetical protein
LSEKSSRGKKREITKEEISDYIDQGYYFRVKKVNGYKYITRRKGREEKSLGRYTEEKWSMIEQTRKPTDDSKVERSPEVIACKPDEITSVKPMELFKQFMEEASLSKGLIMFTDCMHKEDTLCTYWHWETRPSFFDTLDKLDGSDPSSYQLTEFLSEGQKVQRWNVKAQVAFCINCPAYIRKGGAASREEYKHQIFRGNPFLE